MAQRAIIVKPLYDDLDGDFASFDVVGLHRAADAASYAQGYNASARETWAVPLPNCPEESENRHTTNRTVDTPNLAP